MYWQGIIAEGIKYGAVGPADFSGLAGWWRSTDKIEFASGNLINKWGDLTINNRHLTSYVNSTGAAASSSGNLVNTVNGLAVTGGDSSNSFACTSDLTFKKMLYDGRPITLIVVLRINIMVTSSGFSLLRSSSTIPTDRGYFTLGAPTGSQAVRTSNFALSSSAIAVNDIAGAYPSLGGHVIAVKDYGYDAASSLLHRQSYFDGNFKVAAKFSQAPSQLDHPSPFRIQSASTANQLYEIILYDNTGKSQGQIDAEYNSLYTDYILKRYPNLYL